MDWQITRLVETGSTNDDARQAAESGAPTGSVFWALKQNTGRGRQGRQWQSPEGNLYFSAVLRPLGQTQNYGLYSFVAALAIGDMAQELLPLSKVELKWPNDVLVGGKKISGILLEAGHGFLIAGMGINVHYCPDNALYPVTSLLAEGADLPELQKILERVLKGLLYWNEKLEKEGFGPLRQAWLERARKGEMRVRLPQEEVFGQFSDLDEDGRLHLILTDGSLRKFSTGDVFF